ncbi:MAG: CUAEP/CCAEP-tail radical SAM protein [Anaerolineae bacterium]
MSVPLRIILVSTYEMGRQPFGLASPAAWLREAGFQVECVDLSIEAFSEDSLRAADLIAFYVPMHTATRMAVRALSDARRLNPRAHFCFFGLYAAENVDYLKRLGVDTILGGEFETSLVNLASWLAATHSATAPAPVIPTISLERQAFRVPDRHDLPPLDSYAHLALPDGSQRTVGYVEASRGCKHLCRHCPIVPVYNGRFRLVGRDVVLADIRQQVDAGAEHITFGDPDFFNGIGHALPLVEALHSEFPRLTYDVTIKVEHLRKHIAQLPTLKATGCLFITSAVESFDSNILDIFDKQHTAKDFETVLTECQRVDLPLVPTFVAFTPWTTLDGYRAFLQEIARLGLVDSVAPVQYTIRLLIPPGSRLLELPDVQAIVGNLDEEKLSYEWRNADPRVDALQRELSGIVQRMTRRPRREVFARVWKHAFGHASHLPQLPPSTAVPYVTEPWFC